MIDRIKKLIILSMIYYINNYAYAFIKTFWGLDGLVELWAFSPYILLFFTTSMIESSNEPVFKEIKPYALIDFFLRIISMFINFYITTLDGFKVTIFFFIEFILMCINLYLQFKMYIKIKDFKYHDKTLSKEEIKSIINSKYLGNKESFINDKNVNFELVSLSGNSKILMYFIFLWTGTVIRFMKEKYLILTTFIMIISLVLYLKLEYKKLKMFYKDNTVFKKIYIRDNLTFICGLIFLYISENIIYMNTHDHNFFVYIIASLSLVGTLSTNQAIALNFNKEIVESKN